MPNALSVDHSSFDEPFQGLPDHAVSAQAARRRLPSVLVLLQGSEYFHRDRTLALQRLGEIGVECASDGWDGYGALSISKRVVDHVTRVIETLPFSFPVPELAPEADGEISLDWETDLVHSFSLSIGAGDSAAYAWMDGPRRNHGSVSVDSGKIPTNILSLIREILHHGRSSVGSS